MTRFFPEDKDFKSSPRFPDEEYEDDPMSYERPSDPLPVTENVSRKRARLISMLRHPDGTKTPKPAERPQASPQAPKPTTGSGGALGKRLVIEQFWEDGPDEFSFDYSQDSWIVPRARNGTDLTVLTKEEGAIQLEDGATLVKVGKILAVCPKP